MATVADILERKGSSVVCMDKGETVLKATIEMNERRIGGLVILDKGRMVEQGTHKELAAKEGGLYAKLVRMQTEMQSVMAL